MSRKRKPEEELTAAEQVRLARRRRRSKWSMYAGLVAFTAASAALNAVAARMSGAPEWLHAAIPVIMLAALVYFEMAMLSRLHGVAGLTFAAGLIGIAGTTLIASYLSILEVLLVWGKWPYPAVTCAVAAVPDVMMASLTAGLVSIRLRADRAEDGITATEPKTPNRWARIAGKALDTAANRAEGRLDRAAAKTQVDNLVEASMNPSTEVKSASTEASLEEFPASVEPSIEVSVDDETPSTKPSVEPSTEAAVEEEQTSTDARSDEKSTSVEAAVEAKPRPASRPKPAPVEEFPPAVMAAAEEMVAANLVARKTPRDLARIITAVDSGKSNNEIRRAGLGSPSTVDKVRGALAEHRGEEPGSTPAPAPLHLAAAAG